MVNGNELPRDKMLENEENEPAELKEAMEAIDEIMKRSDYKIRNKLITHILSMWLTEKSTPLTLGDNSDTLDHSIKNSSDTTEILDDPIKALDSIAASIKPKVPRTGILPSETLIRPKNEEKNYDDLNTIEIDCFLYDDEDLDCFEDKGELSRYYCKDCGSKEIKFLNIVSNSMNREELFILFNDCLPILDNKTVLDVGSRLGAVLYGAYVFTDAAKIIGVEMNKDFCDIQTETIEKFRMKNRIEVINKKIQDVPDVLESADVVVLNNIFDLYLPEEKHPELWYFLKKHIKTGAFIVCQPPIEYAVKNLNLNINLDEWVKKVTDNTDFTKVDFRKGAIPCYMVI